MISFSKDAKTCLVLSSLERETTALVRLDAHTGAVLETIAASEQCNTGGVLLDEDTKEVRAVSPPAAGAFHPARLSSHGPPLFTRPAFVHTARLLPHSSPPSTQLFPHSPIPTAERAALRAFVQVRAVSFNYARTERTFFDTELEGHFATLQAAAPAGAEVSIASRTRDESLWVVSYRRDDGPVEYVTYEKATGATLALFVSQPSLLPYTFAPMEDVRIEARDGLELVAYLTRADTEQPTPLVLLVHGGPWARDFWGFNPSVQWLANRGYAVLQVNYRGSSGYSKSFLHKGDKQWGVGDMQHDLSDAVAWAVRKGIALEDKVCIYGGSYGGYACLAGLTFTPELYKCGVDIVGPSNIKTLLDSIPPYWGPLRNDMLKKIGDVDADTVFNEQISPLFHADKIRAPLLIGQGANDPRVKQAESDQIAFKLKSKDIAVEYVLYPDEGHGFQRPPNRIDFNGRSELFLAQHLGGRAEDFEAPPGSTATFPLEEAFDYEPAEAIY